MRSSAHSGSSPTNNHLNSNHIPPPHPTKPSSRSTTSTASASTSSPSNPNLKKKISITTFTAVARTTRSSHPPPTRNNTTDSTPNSTPTPNPPPFSTRTPFALKQDATNRIMRNLNKPPTSSKEGPPTSSRMPLEPASSRQQRLTVAKPPNKLTPKIAATTNPPQRVTLATPGPRRPARPDSALSSNNGGRSVGGRESIGDRLAPKDDYASPVSAFLQNVTPRSGSRQSRVQSSNNSPNPSEAQDTWDSRSGVGLGIKGPGLDDDASRRTGVTFAAAPKNRRPEQPPRQSSADRDSKFFFASDANAKSKPPPAQSRPQPLQPTQQKGPTFFYANGENLAGRPAGPTISPAILSPKLASSASTPDPMGSKFVYANGSDLQPSLMSGSSRPTSVVSTTSRLAASQVGNGRQSPALMAQRPPSPVKMPSYLPQNPAAPTLAERRSKVASAPPQLGQQNAALRRISAEPPPRRTSGHSRSGSLVGEVPSVSRVLATSTISESPAPSPMAFSNPSLSLASILQAADEVEEQDDNESLVSGLASPKSQHGNDPLNDLVANARRERKVQDLQITNASLEAINRTLERQLRKQTTELRRFKRLSRASRLSSVNTTVQSRVASTSTDGEAQQGPLNTLDLSDLSEEKSDPDGGNEELDESEVSESESSEAAELSPHTMAERDARHRKRDQKRLHIDLSKHQQLLVDSQKMNQSLKRCLGWTEELIREGKRALEYQVKFSDDDMAGRGSTADEDREQYVYDGAALFDRDSDMSPDMSPDENEETLTLRLERIRTDESKAPQDRDSAIVLPGDGNGYGT